MRQHANESKRQKQPNDNASSTNQSQITQSLSHKRITQLQRYIGNQSLQRLLSEQGDERINPAQNTFTEPSDDNCIDCPDNDFVQPIQTVQRVEEDCIDCPDTTMQRSPENTIQRFSLPKIDLPDIPNPAAIFDQVREQLDSGDEIEAQAEQDSSAEVDKTPEALKPVSEEAEQDAEQITQDSEEAKSRAETEQSHQQAALASRSDSLADRSSRTVSAISSASTKVPTLLSPITPLINPDSTYSTANNMIKVIQEVADGDNWEDLGNNIATSIDDGLKADGEEGWNCDEREVMSIGMGIGMDLLEPFAKAANILSGGRLDDIAQFGLKMGRNILKVGNGIKDSITTAGSRASKWLANKTKPLRHMLGKVGQKVGSIVNATKKRVGQSVKFISSKLKSGARTVYKHTKSFVKSIASTAKSKAVGLWNKAKSIIKTVQAITPNWIKDKISKLANTGKKIGSFVKTKLIQAKDLAKKTVVTVLDRVRQKANEKLQDLALVIQTTDKFIDEGKQAIDTLQQEIEEQTPQPVKDVVDTVYTTADNVKEKVEDGVEIVKEKVEGIVCVGVNELGMPCMDRFFPYEPGEKVSYTLDAGGTLTVPIPKLPANVAVSQDSQIEVARESETTYTVKTKGTGKLGLTHERGNGLEFGTKDSGDPATKHRKAWNALNNKMMPSMSDLTLEAGAHLIGETEIEYNFDMQNTCDLTIMASLFAAYGVNQAMYSSMPMPFKDMLMKTSLLNLAAFEPYVQSTKLAVGLEGEASADADVGDAAELDAKASVLVKSYVEKYRDEEDNNEEKLRLGSVVGGDVEGELELFNDILDLSLASGGEVDSSIALVFRDNQVDIDELKTKFKGTLRWNGDLEIFSLIPTAKEVLSDLLEDVSLSRGNELELELVGSVKNLSVIFNAIESYILDTDVEQIDVVQLLKVIMDAAKDVKKSFEVKLISTDKTKYRFDPELDLNTKTGNSLGIEGRIGIERSAKKTLYKGEF